jgi:hypothetical protein
MKIALSVLMLFCIVRYANGADARAALALAMAADPCKSCNARMCDDDVCQRSKCEVGHCVTQKTAEQWQTTPRGSWQMWRGKLWWIPEGMEIATPDPVMHYRPSVELMPSFGTSNCGPRG